MPERATRVVEWILLVLLCGIGAWILRPYILREPAQIVDTKLRTGELLTMVLVAPTSAPGSAFADAVKRARVDLRERVVPTGTNFSTIGISDHWSVRQGLAILAAFGDFDEVVVGRNWFNTGVNVYINSVGAQPAVPQLIVTSQMASVDSLPIRYGPRKELLRLLGSQAIIQWANAGSPLQVSEVSK